MHLPGVTFQVFPGIAVNAKPQSWRAFSVICVFLVACLPLSSALPKRKIRNSTQESRLVNTHWRPQVYQTQVAWHLGNDGVVAGLHGPGEQTHTNELSGNGPLLGGPAELQVEVVQNPHSSHSNAGSQTRGPKSGGELPRDVWLYCSYSILGKCKGFHFF